MYWALQAVLWIGGAILFAVVGVVATRKIIHPHVREGHNDVLVPLFLTAGVIYAVLLAFVVIAMWETFDGAKANVSEEASLLVPLYRQSEDMSPAKSAEMHELLSNYAEGVINGWDHFTRTAQGSADARMAVDKIIYLFGTLTPSTKAREIVDAQFFETFSKLMEDRNKRLLQASESLSWIIWLVAVGGGALTVGMAFILYMERRTPQILMVSTLAAMIGSLLFIMAVLNKPFLGPLGITPEPFEASLALFKQIDGDFKDLAAQNFGAEPAPAASGGGEAKPEH
jgi:hypothetical protein